MAFAGGILGALADGTPLKRVWILVGCAVAGLVAATAALQILGFAPAMKIAR